jgi:hypothetical protein
MYRFELKSADGEDAGTITTSEGNRAAGRHRDRPEQDPLRRDRGRPWRTARRVRDGREVDGLLEVEPL